VTRTTWTRLWSPGAPVGDALLAARMRASLAIWRPAADEDRRAKIAIATLAPRFTMMGLARLRALVAHGRTIHRDHIAGCIVECGTWRGGSLALVDWTMRDQHDPRKLWAFDSFEGLPPPGERDPHAAHRSFHEGWCAARPDEVRRAVLATGGDPARLSIVQGWLSDTLPRADTGPIALLTIDVDWYDSVRCVLHNLYDRVAEGGVIHFDDYGCWHGCDTAVHEFLHDRGASSDGLRRVGRHGAWMRKPR